MFGQELMIKNLINKYKDYTINVLNIEREVERPRKDIESFSAVKREIGYMYDELFFNEEKTFERKDYYSKELLEYYIDNVYDEADDKQTWFKKCVLSLVLLVKLKNIRKILKITKAQLHMHVKL